MKIECDLCHATAEPAEMVPRKGGIDFRCSACGAWFFTASRGAGPAAAEGVAESTAPGADGAPAAATAATSRPGEATARTAGAAASVAAAADPAHAGPFRTLAGGAGCPKCGLRRGSGDACRRCGLVFALWNEGVSEVGVLDERGESLWQEIERVWSDPQRHDAFVQYCSRAGLLAGAGRRYRERLDREPGEVVATRMQQRIVGMAVTMLGPHEPIRTPVTRTKWFTAVVVGAAVVAGIAGLVFGR